MSLRPFFTWLFTPLARRLIRTNPNALTAFSILAGLGAGAAFYLANGRPAYLAGATAGIAMSGAADALDGLVARLSGRVSKWGEVLDHFGDRLIDLGILGGIAALPGATPQLGAAVIVLALLHGYLGTQIEATFGVRDYHGAGKAELFVGLIAFGTLLTVVSMPGVSADAAAWLPDAFLAVLGAATVIALAFRLRHARELGRQRDAGRSDSEPHRWDQTR